MLYPNLSVNAQGHLEISGRDSVRLAEEFGTPLYVMDEDVVRENCRKYVRAFKRNFKEGSMPLYASKALSCKAIYSIVAEEGMGADVVSTGEMYTAVQAGFPVNKLYFHGNNKTDADIRYAIDCGIGYFVIDNREEIAAVSRIAGEKGIVQKALLRLTPGIDPHTFAAVNTGRIDCQFGTPIETGQAGNILGEVLNAQNIELMGYHFHLGSQIAEPRPYLDAVDILLGFADDMRNRYGYVPSVLNLGGGFGVKYVESGTLMDIEAGVDRIAVYLKAGCAARALPMPQVLIEPGRSIVANAGVTLYSVGSVKTIEGYRSYVSVDGGMTDNPRYALYQAAYTVLLANRASEPTDFLCTVAGRCCESGDLIQENILLPKPKRGDILAVLTTGAYNYAMASNYNRVGRPAMVFIRNGKARLAVRRETREDLTACDLKQINEKRRLAALFFWRFQRHPCVIIFEELCQIGSNGMIVSALQLTAIFAVPALILKYRDNKFTRLFGTIGMAYFYGIMVALAIYVVNLLGVEFTLDSDIGEIGSYAAIGVAIPLLLFGSNLKEVKKLTRTVLLSFGSLVISVVLVAIAASYLYGGEFQWGKELCAMSTGLYTGGTPNFNAIGVILKVDNGAIAIGNLADMVFGGIFYVFILLLAKPLLSKILRNSSTQDSYLKAGKGATNVDVLQNGTWNWGIVRNVLLSLAIVVAGVGVGTLLWLAQGARQGALVDQLVPGIMVTATLLGIALSFCKQVREVRENTLVGQYLILVFSFALASSLDLSRLSTDFQKILLLLSGITLISALVHVIISKLLGIDADCTIVTMTAGIYGPAFIPAVTGQLKNDRLTAPGLICGALGYAIGTALGVALYCIL